MSETYFIKRGESINGPFTLKKLQKALSDKKLKANDELAVSSDGPWERLSALHKDIKAGKPPLIAEEAPVDAESIIDEWMADDQPAPSQPLPEVPEPSPRDDALSLPSQPHRTDAEYDDEVDDQPLPSAKVATTSRDVADEVQSKKRPSNGKPIIPIVAGGILVVAVIGIAAVFMRGGEENAAETAPSEINKELFDKPLRAALAFRPGEPIGLIDELKLIEPALKSDGDRQVYGLLQDVVTCQRESQTLEFFTSQEFTGIFEAMKAQGEKALAGFEELGRLNANALKEPDIADALSRASQTYKLSLIALKLIEDGGVIISISCGIPSVDTTYAKRLEGFKAEELANKYKIPITTSPDLQFFDGAELKRALLIGNEALIQVANETIHGVLEERASEL
jgi:hypothetical protein